MIVHLAVLQHCPEKRPFGSVCDIPPVKSHLESSGQQRYLTTASRNPARPFMDPAGVRQDQLSPNGLAPGTVLHGQNLLHHISVNIRQAKVATLVFVGQPRVVDP